jgi:metallophosphoesterase superfamily enzyme
MGHEHPCIVLKDDIGSKHRFKAFLHGSIMLNDKRVSLVVLPSLSPLAYGNPLNEDAVLKSPILREFSNAIDDLVPYIIDVEVTVKRFPEIKYLRYSNRVIL